VTAAITLGAAKFGEAGRAGQAIAKPFTLFSQVDRSMERSQEGVAGVEWWKAAERKKATVTVIDFEPLTVIVPLREDPPGVFRVGNSRVLLELVLRAYKRGESPEGIVRSYRTLCLADVYAVVTRFLANPAPFEEYLRQSDAQAEAVRRQIEASQRPGPTKEELLDRARAKG
jgi:hypothetical protein